MKLALLLLALASPAYAQQGCIPREAVEESLKNDYNEVPLMAGLTQNGDLLEVFGAPNHGSWTIVITNQFQMTCMLEFGVGYSFILEGILGEEM